MARSYRHLIHEKRRRVYILIARSDSQAEIARTLDSENEIFTHNIKELLYT
jgi:hypothetical protein